MTEWRLVDDAALPNGVVGCCWMALLVVVVEKERRFGRPMTLIEGGRCLEGEQRELLKGQVVFQAVRGVEPSCNTVVPPGRGVAQRRGECWSVAASGGGRGV